MKATIQPGKYIVAVSGGVDSMVLLHLLHHAADVELVVAHFDHGIRPESAEDRRFVQQIAQEYGLEFVYAEGNLGAEASEATARSARYTFLRQAQANHDTAAILTAHHKDDVLETAIINIIRGTGRLGLSSLGSSATLIRPLLHVAKADIIAHAMEHGLLWHEDSTNADDSYLRNHIRHNVLPRLPVHQKHDLYGHVTYAREVNALIAAELDRYMTSQKNHGQLDRMQFILLPHKVSLELMAAWLRNQGIGTFNKKVLERLVRGSKILKAGSSIAIDRTTFLRIGKEFLALDSQER